jgi:hypothetical protein
MTRHQLSAMGHRPSAIRYSMFLAGALFLAVSPTRPLAAQGFDRTKAPTVPAPPAFRMPAVQTARLPNGITIDLVEMHELPLVEVDIMIRGAGARMDGELAGLVTASRRHRAQAGQLSDGPGTNIANTAYLVHREKSGAFASRVEQAAAAVPEVRVDLTGPWAPYSFAGIGDLS